MTAVSPKDLKRRLRSFPCLILSARRQQIGPLQQATTTTENSSTKPRLTTSSNASRLWNSESKKEKEARE
jgi:hypothetical protein